MGDPTTALASDRFESQSTELAVVLSRDVAERAKFCGIEGSRTGDIAFAFFGRRPAIVPDVP